MTIISDGIKEIIKKYTLPDGVYRETSTWQFKCKADYIVIEKLWRELPTDLQKAIMEMAGIACEGGGYPGPWCDNCPWGESEGEED